MQEHLSALHIRHSILESKIQREERRPRPDSLRLTALKKIKLSIKERIERVERRLMRPGHA